jgi:putative pyruvate formate lyase activating enzyme
MNQATARERNTCEPAYLHLFADGTLQNRAREAVARLKSCRLCPRQCGAERLSGHVGVCRIGRQARVASYHAHFGEEEPLVGRHGSGTIFFSGCNLLCAFCQNFEISHLNEGSEATAEQLAGMMLALAARSCHNINLVTPTHVVAQILETLPLAAERGLRLPLVYNCGGYESVETLRLLDGVVDIYMPDFKFWEDRWAERFCRAPDYRERACAALQEMHRQVGDLELDAAGLARRGLLVRHLVMPNGIAGTAEIMRFLAHEVSRRTYVNVMAQYRPCGKAVGDDTVGRPLQRREYEEAIRLARAAGLTRLDGLVPLSA